MEDEPLDAVGEYEHVVEKFKDAIMVPELVVEKEESSIAMDSG